jgi:hypothetical protein
MSMNKRTVKLRKNTSSGHGAFGMGGQPTDDPRDQNSGGGKRADDDRTVRVAGAFGGGTQERGDVTPAPGG